MKERKKKDTLNKAYKIHPYLLSYRLCESKMVIYSALYYALST